MSSIILATGPTTPTTRGAVYLPFVATAPIDVAPPPVDQAGAFYDLLLHDSRQQRPRLDVCKTLQAGAVQRAYDLAHGELWAHRNNAGVWANGIARALGCKLPPEYSDSQNYIESLCAGMDSAQVAFDSLARSDHHKVHLFGEADFYRVQHHAGVGFAQNPDAPYQFYWAVWICRCED